MEPIVAVCRRLVVPCLLLLAAGAASAQRASIIGSWRQVGWKLCRPTEKLPAASVDPPIEELLFNRDGTFSVTWTPFETYKDYWGRFRAVVTGSGLGRAPGAAGRDSLAGPWMKGTLELVIDHGNFIPSDFAGRGSFVVAGNRLTLDSVRLGTRRATQKLDLCQLTFARE